MKKKSNLLFRLFGQGFADQILIQYFIKRIYLEAGRSAFLQKISSHF
jgi:hypothetical protein